MNIIHTNKTKKSSECAWVIQFATIMPLSTTHATGMVHEVWKRPQPVLTHDEEQVLEDWLVEMASIGYGRTKQQLQHS